MSGQLEPTQVLQRAFDAFARREWQLLVDFIDPKALDSLRQDNLGLTILMAEQVQAGQDPSGGYSPREVNIPDHLIRVGTQRIPGFPDNPTVAELAALSPREFFVRWCEVAYGSAMQANPVEEIPSLYRRILGSVADDAARAQVLYRHEARSIVMGELKVSISGRLAVMPLNRVDNIWRLSLNDDLGRSYRFRPFPYRDHIPVTYPALPPRVLPPALPPSLSQRVGVRPDPADVVRNVFSAFDRADWAALSGTVDEDQLRTFRNQQIAYLVAWPSMREARMEAESSGISIMMFSYDDSLSPAVIGKAADLTIPGFPSSLPVGKLAELSPAQFFETWCAVAYGRQSIGLKTNVQRRVLGQIFESDTTAHVLYRSDGWYAVKVMSLRWSGDRWKILFNDDIGWSGDLDLVLDSQ